MESEKTLPNSSVLSPSCLRDFPVESLVVYCFFCKRITVHIFVFSPGKSCFISKRSAVYGSPLPRRFTYIIIIIIILIIAVFSRIAIIMIRIM